MPMLVAVPGLKKWHATYCEGKLDRFQKVTGTSESTARRAIRNEGLADPKSLIKGGTQNRLFELQKLWPRDPWGNKAEDGFRELKELVRDALDGRAAASIASSVGAGPAPPVLRVSIKHLVLFDQTAISEGETLTQADLVAGGRFSDARNLLRAAAWIGTASPYPDIADWCRQADGSLWWTQNRIELLREAASFYDTRMAEADTGAVFEVFLRRFSVKTGQRIEARDVLSLEFRDELLRHYVTDRLFSVAEHHAGKQSGSGFGKEHSVHRHLLWLRNHYAPLCFPGWTVPESELTLSSTDWEQPLPTREADSAALDESLEWSQTGRILAIWPDVLSNPHIDSQRQAMLFLDLVRRQLFVQWLSDVPGEHQFIADVATFLAQREQLIGAA